MAGSGGGAGRTTDVIPPPIAEALTLLLEGKADLSGLGATESALRFIFEMGLTSQGGNPFEGVSAYNTDEKLSETQTRLDAYLEKVDSLVPITDWGTYLAQALADENTTIAAVDIDTMLTDIVTIALTKATAALTQAAVDALAQTADVTADGAGEADVLIPQAAAITDAEAQDSIELAETVADGLVPAMETIVSAEATDMFEAAEEAVSALFPTMENAVSNETEDLINEAIVVATTAVSNEIVTSMVAAYEARALTQHLRAVNRFAGGMADINAVNSSAFVIGMALKEVEFSRDVDDFQTKTESDLYNKAFDGFLAVGKANINAYMGAIGYFAQLTGTNVSAYMDTVNTFADLTKSYMAQWVGIMNTRVGLYRDALLEYGREYTEYIAEHMRGTMATRQFLQDDVKVIAGLHNDELERHHAVSSLAAEINRIYIVAKAEEYASNLEYDTKSANWDMELFQMGGNLVSAYSGGNIGIAGKPSRTQSTLGGGLAGAAAGAKLGTAIPGLGTAAGATIGGIAGLIAGYQG